MIRFLQTHTLPCKWVKDWRWFLSPLKKFKPFFFFLELHYKFSSPGQLALLLRLILQEGTCVCLCLCFPLAPSLALLYRRRSSHSFWFKEHRRLCGWVGHVHLRALTPGREECTVVARRISPSQQLCDWNLWAGWDNPHFNPKWCGVPRLRHCHLQSWVSYIFR